MKNVGVEIRISCYVMRYQAYLFVCTSDPGGTGGCTQYIAVLQFSTIPEPYSLWPTGCEFDKQKRKNWGGGLTPGYATSIINAV